MFGATGAPRSEREEDLVEFLVLRRSDNLLFDRQMVEEGLDLGLTHIDRVAFTVNEDETPVSRPGSVVRCGRRSVSGAGRGVRVGAAYP